MSIENLAKTDNLAAFSFNKMAIYKDPCLSVSTFQKVWLFLTNNMY